MKINRRKIRRMIQEALRLGYTDLEGGDRSEFYGGRRRAMDFGEEDLDPDYDVLGLSAMGLMGDPYSIDASADAMDANIDLYPSDDLSALEREMSRQGRMAPHHHDDDYADLEMDALADLGDDDMMMETSKGQKMKISRRELRSMISEQMGEDMMMTPPPRMISMSNPVSALREVMAAMSAGESFAITIDGDTIRAVARVFNMPVEEGSLQEQPVPAPLILAGVGMVILLGLIAFGIHKGYGVRLRGGGGIGGKKGPRGEGEVIFAPGGQDIPDTSIGKELSAEKAKMLAAGE
tara:strand:+ start:371 stop:1249 length:879 start_codon:yes stop_codon:yes gene_type:complete